MPTAHSPQVRKTSWAHRRLTFSPHFVNPMRGPDVRILQEAVNRFAKAHPRLRITHLVVDGQFGRQTLAQARRVARALGIGLRGHGVSAYVQHLIRHPGQRTPIQKRRAMKWRTVHREVLHPRVSGNTVTGGTGAQRVVAALFAAATLYYEHKSSRFYSQTGVTTFDHAITGEHPGERSDCSQFWSGSCHSAGVQDPCLGDYNPNALHYTGTAWKGGHFVRREQLRPGGAILYGVYPTFHHIEGYVGDGDVNHTWADMPVALRDRTIGHGSPPVDFGDIDMIAGAHFVNYDHTDA